MKVHYVHSETETFWELYQRKKSVLKRSKSKQLCTHFQLLAEFNTEYGFHKVNEEKQFFSLLYLLEDHIFENPIKRSVSELQETELILMFKW